MSQCMLFSLCQFTIPLTLQIYYNIFPLYINTSCVIIMGIYYHTKLILTGDNWRLRLADQTVSGIASICIIIYGKNSPTTLLLALGVPIFYTLELVAINKYKIKNNFIGAAGLHSLVHISAISASSYIVFFIKGNIENIENIENINNISNISNIGNIGNIEIMLTLCASLVGVILFFASKMYFNIN
jgi:hypothetical protein